ncbi:hypothetical protein IWW37_004552 [Coemansia sp. RSA 2050]|nr:hypothetical protein IWW37_004552 [Coemansia sp. RSA 2050]
MDGLELPRLTLSELEYWGRYAGAAYDEFEDWETCGRCQATEDLRQTVVVAKWSTAAGGFSRGYVGVNHRRRQVVVAFRGTTHVLDTVTDARVLQARWPPHVNGSLVHSGFLAAYRSAQRHVGGVDGYYGYSVAFVGHSLGGAQAVLAMADYCGARECGGGLGGGLGGGVALVTFGAPRVGNRVFATYANSLLPGKEASWRVVHGSDMVAQLPRSLVPTEHSRCLEHAHGSDASEHAHGSDVAAQMPRSPVLMEYVHGDREVWVRDRIALCGVSPALRAEEDPLCSASVHSWQWSMWDHMEYPGISLLWGLGGDGGPRARSLPGAHRACAWI